jgi:hypothetical protein
MPLFGDTHLHTSFSMDAGAFGARLTPRDAYRFARGEETHVQQRAAREAVAPARLPRGGRSLRRHGLLPAAHERRPDAAGHAAGPQWYDQIRGGQGGEAALDIIRSFGLGQMPKGFPQPGTPAYRNAWMETIKAAEAYNEPGRFTALHRLRVDFEHRRQQPAPQRDLPRQWRAGEPGRALHHAQAARQRQPGDLWKWMATPTRQTGSEVLAIAHNGNLSNGLMFPMVEAFGKKALDSDYVLTRARWEPLYEVTQTKGTGEAHPSCRPTTSSRTSRSGTRATSTARTPKTPTCSSSSTRARR